MWHGETFPHRGLSDRYRSGRDCAQRKGPLPPKLAQLKSELKSVQNIFSVERLDYSKGLPERFLAYEALLENYPQHHGKIRYTQIAPTSRGDVQAYQDIRHQLETAAGRINGRMASWAGRRFTT
jgi:trehalose 6-phosphate synthase